MAASASRERATSQPRASPDAGDLTVALDAAFAELVAAQAASGERSADAMARHAVVAIASALLRRAGMRQSRVAPAEDLVAPAAALIDDAPDVAPADAADALAALFERAIGQAGKRDQGAVYTPPEIVDFMVIETLAARCTDALGVSPAVARAVAGGDVSSLSDRQARELAALLDELRIVDPAVGAGAFLVGAARRISGLAGALADAGVGDLTALSTPAGALRHCCHGYELDADAVSIATAVLCLATEAYRADMSAPVVTQRNPLLAGMAEPQAEHGWDIVLMNPPYLGEKYVRSRLGDRFAAELRKADGFSGDLLSHFVIRALSAVRPGGVVSAIISDTAFTMETTSALRRELVDNAVPLSIAWCRPFRTVAVQGGVITVARPPFHSRAPLEWIDAPARSAIVDAPRRRARRDLLRKLPGRQLFRPTDAARTILERWASVESLDAAWREVGRRNGVRSRPDAPPREGTWTLLGDVVRGGQGLATGDDRRFVGALAGTDDAARSAARQRRLLEALRDEPDRKAHWDHVRERLGAGHQLGDALAELLDVYGADDDVLPERKPFRIVERADVRTSPLTREEVSHGIAAGPSWIPYETSDRSSARGGRRWTRDNPFVLDWSREAVALLRRRRESGERRPVLRNEDLWFRGGVTHNRVTSYLRARMMPEHAIFSSESPVYVSTVDWLDAHTLLALLNAPVVEYVVKTFLASRNHIEVGHVLRIPVPVLAPSQSAALARLGRDALACGGAADANRLSSIEAELDDFTRELYGIGAAALDLAR